MRETSLHVDLFAATSDEHYKRIFYICQLRISKVSVGCNSLSKVPGTWDKARRNPPAPDQ